MTIDYSKVLFSSDLNYQKIALSGTTTASVPFATDTTVTIPHNLGYVPTAQVFFEPMVSTNGISYSASNQIWPLADFQYGDIVNATVTFDLGTTGYAYLDDTNLYVVLFDTSGSTVNIPLYYRIYYDS